jgi:hypothetical protein
MKTKIWTQVAFYTLLFGWVPFLWLSIFGSWNREIGVYIMLFGLLLCLLGTMLMMPILRNNDLFKYIDELEEERTKLYETRKRLEARIEEL